VAQILATVADSDSSGDACSIARDLARSASKPVTDPIVIDEKALRHMRTLTFLSDKQLRRLAHSLDALGVKRHETLLRITAKPRAGFPRPASETSIVTFWTPPFLRRRSYKRLLPIRLQKARTFEKDIYCALVIAIHS
jgi:hypothetical protein